MNNPIIQEVRDAREALAAKFNFNLHRIFEDAVKRQASQKVADTLSKQKQAAAAPPSNDA